MNTEQNVKSATMEHILLWMHSTGTGSLVRNFRKQKTTELFLNLLRQPNEQQRGDGDAWLHRIEAAHPNLEAGVIQEEGPPEKEIR